MHIKTKQMKLLMLGFIIFCSCNTSTDNKETQTIKTDSLITEKQIELDTSFSNTIASDSVYSNPRFRNVTKTNIGVGIFEIKGEARVFEATVNYILRQGKEESDVAFTSTSKGAPEWGEFKFTINSTIFNANVPLYLILFETSAKDGSRLDELTIKLF